MTTRPTVATMPRRLRQLRLAAGLTLDALALASGSSKSAIVQIEAGKRAPSFELACRLADALGVSVETFRQPLESPL